MLLLQFGGPNGIHRPLGKQLPWRCTMSGLGHRQVIEQGLVVRATVIKATRAKGARRGVATRSGAQRSHGDKQDAGLGVRRKQRARPVLSTVKKTCREVPHTGKPGEFAMLSAHRLVERGCRRVCDDFTCTHDWFPAPDRNAGIFNAHESSSSMQISHSSLQDVSDVALTSFNPRRE